MRVCMCGWMGEDKLQTLFSSRYWHRKNKNNVELNKNVRNIYQTFVCMYDCVHVFGCVCMNIY